MGIIYALYAMYALCVLVSVGSQRRDQDLSLYTTRGSARRQPQSALFYEVLAM